MSKYEVVDKFWSNAKFNIQVVKIPIEKINDKLAVLSDGSGTITFDRYDTFLLNTCLVDSGKIWSFIDTLEGDPETLVNAAVELRNIILEVNPFLDPKLLVINSENIIKLPEVGHTPENSRRLIENPDWEKPEFMGPSDSDIEEFIKNLPNPMMPIDMSSMNMDAENFIIEYSKLLNMALTIIVYDQKDIPEIFKSKYTFDEEEPYRMFIVSKCVFGFMNLFAAIDQLGISRKHKPEEIAEDLYNISIKHNPFLSWDSIDLDKVKKAVIDRFGKSTRPTADFTKGTAKGKSYTDRPSGESGVEFYRNFDDLSEEEVIELPGKVKESVVGQSEAIDTICETIRLAKCGLKEPGTPIGAFMLTGETGCGKTYVSKILAKELCGDEHAIVRIDCSEYSQKHEISKLIGSPPGYIRSDEPSYLVSEIQKKTFCIVLLDEIEKAHQRFFDLFLQIIDEGRLTGNNGESASFNDVLILMTSNIGVKEVDSISSRVGIGDTSKLTKESQTKAIKEALKNKFKPEFLNRLDGVITFNRLTEKDCLNIIDLQLKQMNGWLEGKKIVLKYDEGVKKYIYKVGYIDGFGARPLKRTIKKEIALPLSKLILSEKIKADCSINISVKKGTLVFNTGKK